MSDRDSELLQLKNLGIATVNILNAIGVYRLSQLQQLGPAQAYVNIQQRGIHVSKVMLYALQGALNNTHWSDLSPEAKQALVEAADKLAQKENEINSQ
ncbi:MAG: TfoX/Sxy family protein [Cellvibrionaceae bacterium]|nr:TfoX/Sxy family protein [Cellvibrionaceae bacterium]MCV6625584.1 TfoX/Sxy family protein [Cellvibrionaceae bacterium]